MWRRMFLSNFMSDILLLLPIALTGLLMGWAGGRVVAGVDPGTAAAVGGFLWDMGLRFAADGTVAMVIGWLACIWAIGLVARVVAKSGARGLIDDAMSALDRMPAFGTVRKSVKQVVSMFGDGTARLKAMRVVMCRGGGGVA